ncbi:MarR family transcriptional regulator [Streptosporangium soli]|nr:MarR family transcriptional regulator [Streptosporangium sp. KLBMP 9127]
MATRERNLAQVGTEPGSAGVGDVGWALGVLFRAYAKAVGSAVSDLPGGPRGYQVITAAVQEVTTNQGSLAQHLGIDRTVLTYLIDDLEKAGLVERRPDPADRRNRRIVATDAGREACEKRGRHMRHVESYLLGALSDAEAEEFRTMLQRLASHVNALDPLKNACDIADHLEP